MTRSSTNSLLTSSDCVPEAPYMERLSSLGQGIASNSPATSNPTTNELISIACGLPGRRFTLIQNWLHDKVPPSDQFDRNIRAFGGEIQQILGNLNIAVVGCGGTGIGSYRTARAIGGTLSPPL